MSVLSSGQWLRGTRGKSIAERSFVRPAGVEPPQILSAAGVVLTMPPSESGMLGGRQQARQQIFCSTHKVCSSIKKKSSKPNYPLCNLGP